MARWFVDPTTYGIGTAATLTHSADNQTVILSTAQGYVTGQAASVPSGTNRLRVDAIRGRLSFKNSSTTNQHVIQVGIVVVDLVTNAVPTVVSPVAASDAPKSWLYLDHFYLDACTAANGNGMSMITRELHVKSKRILKPEQALLLIVHDVPLSGVADEVSMVQHLRTLISHID